MTLKIGSISAWLAASFATVYSVAQLFVVLTKVTPPPWDLFAIVFPSILLAPAYLISMTCLRDQVRQSERKIMGDLALHFGLLYAALVSIAYITQLAVVIPAILSGQGQEVEPFAMTAGRFITAVDGLGYGFMSISSLFAALCLPQTPQTRFLRYSFLGHGFLAPVIIGALFVTPLMYLGALWIVFVPSSLVLLARYFKHSI